MNVNSIIKDRASTVAFSKTTLEPHILESIFEAARWAPSSYNEQPWRYIYARKGTVAFESILNNLVPQNHVWAKEAPVLIVAVLSKYIERNGRPNKYAWYDLGQSVANLSSQATATGLKMRQMGGFNSEKLSLAFDISEEFEPATVIAIGYPGNPDDLEPALKQRELGIRKRKALDEIVFKESWLGNSPANSMF